MKLLSAGRIPGIVLLLLHLSWRKITATACDFTVLRRSEIELTPRGISVSRSLAELPLPETAGERDVV